MPAICPPDRPSEEAFEEEPVLVLELELDVLDSLTLKHNTFVVKDAKGMYLISAQA
jgi:C4-dicarboxylate-specific signal transduction histidine kinase